MIAYLEGRLLETTEHGCLILTQGGVGYEVALPTHTVSRLPAKGQPVYFYVYTVVREDALELFAFDTMDERAVFLTLISISRVGPRTALSVLSVFRPDDLRRLVVEDDSTGLTRVSGIGKKTAQQMFIDLKYKLKGDVAPGVPGFAPQAPSVLADAVAALANLGYSEAEALPLVKKALSADPGQDVAGILRQTLKALARG